MLIAEEIETLKRLRTTTLLFAALTILSVPACSHAVRAEEKSTQDLAKAAQNPIADLISLPLQNKINFGVGPGDDLQNVIPIGRKS